MACVETVSQTAPALITAGVELVSSRAARRERGKQLKDGQGRTGDLATKAIYSKLGCKHVFVGSRNRQ